MTATEELHRLLDERGVEHGWAENQPDQTWWKDQDGHIYFAKGINNPMFFNLTPAQAIAATLGTGTCHLEEIDKDCDTASEYMLDREWCFDAVYRCSCGCRFGHVAHARPRYCPNCGAKVVDE